MELAELMACTSGGTGTGTKCVAGCAPGRTAGVQSGSRETQR